jgi:L-fuconolactonase
MTSRPRIDAHHHLWRFNDAEFVWIDDSMAVLRRDFLVNELMRELESVAIDGTVAVQARETIEETDWLLECARLSPVIWGVVGWAPLASDELPKILDRFGENQKLVGYREIVQGKPDGYLLQPSFNRGIRELTDRGVSYDILIHERQLAEVTRFVDQHPYQRFVLDHAAKPRISKNELEPWKMNLRELAKRPNVLCKISGLVTEADWQSWNLEALRPYLDACVEAFGPQRLMAGSDWPVCLVASSYSRWWDVLARYFVDFSESETRRIFGENAVVFYRLPAASVDGTFIR